MKKSYIIGLVTLLSFSNTTFAAPTSLSTTDAWQTASGDLSSLLGQAAPATWRYDTDLTIVPQLALNIPLDSGGTLSAYGFDAPTYTLSGTAAPDIFDGSGFAVNIFDNTIAAIDNTTDTTELENSMLSHGLDLNVAGDVLIFATSTELHQGSDPVESYDLYGLMLFGKDFFSGPIVSLPPAETLLEQSLFTYAALTHSFDFVQTGFASYAQSQIPSAVPIPAAVFLFAPVLLGFLSLRRRTKGAVI